MHRNLIPSSQSNDNSSVSEFVKTIVESYAPELSENSIAVETDFETVKTTFNDVLVRSVTKSLIENAMNKMPNGGVISLTLIDGKHQWELEVADSDGMAYNNFAPNSSHSIESGSNLDVGEFRRDNTSQTARNPENDTCDLPMVVPFPETESLQRAHLAATNLGGQIQTWDCPQGGTAHVFVAPKPRRSDLNQSV